MKNYFRATAKIPYHLSVGVVPVNEALEVLVHYYPRKNELDNVYWLGHTTVTPNKSLEESVYRCLLEEFGATGEISNFLCSRNSQSIWWNDANQEMKVQKTTIYFLVKLIDFNLDRISETSPEFNSEKRFVNIDDLIKINHEQFSRLPEYVRYEFDESEPLEVAKLLM